MDNNRSGLNLSLHCDETYNFSHVALFPEGDTNPGIEGQLILSSPSVGSSSAFLRFTPDIVSSSSVEDPSSIDVQFPDHPNTKESLLSSGEDDGGFVMVSPGSTAQSYGFTVFLRKILVLKRSLSPAGHSVILVTLQGGVNLLPLHFLPYVEAKDGSSVMSSHRVPPFLRTFAKFATLTPSEPDPNIMFVDFPNAPADDGLPPPSPLSASTSQQAIDGENSGDATDDANWNPAWGLFGRIKGLASTLLPVSISSYLPSATVDAKPYPDHAPDEIVDEFEDMISQSSPNPLFLNSHEMLFPQIPEPTDRLPPFTSLEWLSLFDQEGRITVDVEDVRKRIFLGGLTPDIRHQIWPFLLGVFPWHSTVRERARLLREAHEEYHTYKLQWTSMTPVQLSRFSLFRGVISIIEKDVHRTDRDLPFFQDDSTLDKLKNILLSYAMFNFDLGYGQGMNDLLAPILVVFSGDEVLSFACFVKFMNAQQDNFQKDSTYLRKQIQSLGRILSILDPELHTYLSSIEAWESFFPVRWLLCHFKREFSIVDTMMIWEALWSQWLPNSILHLFLVAAILHQHRDQIIHAQLTHDQLLQFVNNLAGTLSAKELLIRTHYLHSVFVAIAPSQDLKELL